MHTLVWKGVVDDDGTEGTLSDRDDESDDYDDDGTFLELYNIIHPPICIT